MHVRDGVVVAKPAPWAKRVRLQVRMREGVLMTQVRRMVPPTTSATSRAAGVCGGGWFCKGHDCDCWPRVRLPLVSRWLPPLCVNDGLTVRTLLIVPTPRPMFHGTPPSMLAWRVRWVVGWAGASPHVGGAMAAAASAVAAVASGGGGDDGS